MTNRVSWMLVVGTALLLLSACGAKAVRTYEGSPRSSHEVAIVKTALPRMFFPGGPNAKTDNFLSGYLDIRMVDGRPTTSVPLEDAPYQVELLPGTHVIQFQLIFTTPEGPFPGTRYNGDGQISQSFEAGKTYVLDARADTKAKKVLFYLRPPHPGEV